MKRADKDRYKAAIANAEAWLLHTEVKSVLDAAAVLLAIDDIKSERAEAQKDKCLDLIRKGQASNGGWGPYVQSAPEPFDTAVVVLALVHHARRAELKQKIQAARGYLIATQFADGSWPETTRPAGAESYAQRISTTSWAVLALLKSSPDAGR